MPPASWMRWPGMDLPALPRWAAGRLALLGDDGHFTTDDAAAVETLRAGEDARMHGAAQQGIGTDHAAGRWEHHQVPFEPGQSVREGDLIARIDEHHLLRHRVVQEPAVLLERADDEGGDVHQADVPTSIGGGGGVG